MSFCVVGRLLSNKGFHFDSLRSTILQSFNPLKGADVKLIGDNRWLFRFNHHLDQRRVLENYPWAFDKHLLILHSVDAEENPATVDLEWCEFHVHVHDLPLGKMTREMAEFIGNHIGKFRDVDTDTSGVIWGDTMRIQVSLNVNKPLWRVLKSDHRLVMNYW
ncbi:hypothetical protein Salat_1107700 [Sesamum alatum]|uniref:DUF4283 domain-containing protein n=1 Tax=Sesamum alatum TaxID=300844 RepID=A0AAE1YN28_9LAMI|nr:hypothetical protein Salat_1107700 [Sesamum alatum]